MSETYRPRVGDKVKVTSVVEGVVTAVHDDDNFDLEGPHYYAKRPDNEVERTIELLKPAWFKPETVVRLPAGVATRANDGAWYWALSGTRSLVVSDSHVRGQVANGRAELIHEPAS